MTTQVQFGIRIAEPHDLEALAPLVDAYRVACGAPSDVAETRHYLMDRMLSHQALLYGAWEGKQPVGFLQMFLSCSTPALTTDWGVQDLYALPEIASAQSILQQLLGEALAFSREREDRQLSVQKTPVTEGYLSLLNAAGFSERAEASRFIKKL